MSQETSTDLNLNTLIGMTDKRGNAWHYRAEEQGEESNHYAGAIPVEDVRRRLFPWHVVEGQISATHIKEDGSGVITGTDPKRKAIMRDDTGKILGVFKDGYKPHQFDQWLVDNVANILDSSLVIGSAGVLKEGAQAWVQIELPDTMEAAEGVQFRPFLTAATSHDGSIATTYMTGVQVVVCDNTLSAALRAGDTDKVKVRHSRNSLGRITEVREGLGIVFEVADAFERQVKELTSRVVSDDQWREFVSLLTNPGPNPSSRSKNMAQTKVEELQRLWKFDPRVAPWTGSAYGVLAAVNTHAHHIQTVRNVSRADRNAARLLEGGVDKLDIGTLALLEKVL